MRGWMRAMIVLVVGTLPAPGLAAPDKKLEDALSVARKTEVVFEDLARRVEPAVVSVTRFVKDEAWWNAARQGKPLSGGWQTISHDDLLYTGMRPTGGGSGFLISKDGFILTLRRVVIEPGTDRVADTIDVQVGIVHYRAAVVGMEPTIDLAILKITPAGPVPFLKLGDSGKARVGHWAIAFGDPAGNEKTMVPGVVSYEPSRECYQDELSATYLQTSMRVSDGALGGPVVNLDGEVIGITTRRGDSLKPESLVGAAGSGYALPINLATAIYRSLLARTSHESPWLGISVRLLTDDLRKQAGAPPGAVGIYIDNVFDPSPATLAGIKVGDILGIMDGNQIANVYDFQRKLYELGVGAQVRLNLIRGRRLVQVTAEITARPREATTR